MRLLIVEDSATVITYLQGVLAKHKEIEVLTPAMDGRVGVARALQERPDVILMDLNLPELGGVGAIRRILQEAAIPIVVLSGNLDATTSFEALQAGAVDLLPKPKGFGKEPLAEFERRLVRTLITMKEARVIRRGSDSFRRRELGSFAQVVLIGASTGGPEALRQIFAGLTAPLSVPLVVVQHTYPGFDAGLVRWLGTWIKTSLAEDGAPLVAGEVLVCPAESHLVLRGQGVVGVLPQQPEDLTPSVDRMFLSGAEVWGGQAVGILLTGMGEDGAAGLQALRRSGALTITQRADTCVVDGMPAAARALGASTQELDLQGIAALLMDQCGSRDA